MTKSAISTNDGGIQNLFKPFLLRIEITAPNEISEEIIMDKVPFPFFLPLSFLLVSIVRLSSSSCPKVATASGTKSHIKAK
jgi:hypothetical protein